LEEVEAHMNMALTCSGYAPTLWRGRVPYLYGQFLRTGRTGAEFRKWLGLFRGSERPADDLAEFLEDTLAMKREELKAAAEEVGEELRWAAVRLWTDAHNSRRSSALMQTDPEATRRLIQNDVETYLGVIALRRRERVTELGYRHWLLTFDHNAWAIRDLLKAEFPEKMPPSPLLSLTFLCNSVTFGPGRAQVGKADDLSLPLILDIEMTESMPYDIVGMADQVRRDNEGLPERVIRRNVRDAIDRARRSKSYRDETSALDKDKIDQGSEFNAP